MACELINNGGDATKYIIFFRQAVRQERGSKRTTYLGHDADQSLPMERQRRKRTMRRGIGTSAA